MGCFPVDFQEVKRPLRTKSVKRPIKVGKRPINEGKRPIKAKVLVGVSVGSLMGCFRAPPPWRKTAPLKRPIKRSSRKWYKECRNMFMGFSQCAFQTVICEDAQKVNNPFEGLLAMLDGEKVPPLSLLAILGGPLNFPHTSDLLKISESNDGWPKM